MKTELSVEGFRDIERALAQLPAGTAKGVARRAMRKELQPVKDTAEAFWPGANEAFRVTSALKSSQRPAVRESRSVTNMFVGSFEPHAHLVEFGTGPRYNKAGAYRGSVAPQPVLQPAWDIHKRQILAGLGARMWDEITKTIERRARRAAR